MFAAKKEETPKTRKKNEPVRFVNNLSRFLVKNKTYKDKKLTVTFHQPVNPTGQKN